MNRIKTKSTGIVLRITAVLTAILFCAAVPAQTALTGHATNSLGSQGSVNNGDSEGGNEGAEDAGGDDAELNEIINENSEEGINGTTVAKIKIIAASARVRSEASTNSSVVGSLSSGDVMDVTGETTGSEGKIWYQITGEKDGKAINGYVREDTLEIAETVQPAAPAEPPEETPAETPSDTAPSTNDYDVSYADDGTGTNDWYLNDNINGTRYKVSDLLGAAQTNESNIAEMEKQTGSLRMIIIILAVIVGLLVVAVTVLIFKLKGTYDDGYDEFDDDDSDISFNLIYSIIERLHALQESHNISCACGSEDIELNIINGNIILTCLQCKKSKAIETTEETLTRLLNAKAIIIGK